MRNTARKFILPAAAIHVYGWEGVGAAVIVQDHGGLVAVLPQVQLQGVAVLRGIPAHSILACFNDKRNGCLKMLLLYFLTDTLTSPFKSTKIGRNNGKHTPSHQQNNAKNNLVRQNLS
jgi:hypothetical protein